MPIEKYCYYKNCNSKDVFPLKINAKSDTIELMICKKHYYIFLNDLFNIRVTKNIIGKGRNLDGLIKENKTITFEGLVCGHLDDEFFAPIRVIAILDDNEEEIINFVNEDMKFKITLEKI